MRRLRLLWATPSAATATAAAVATPTVLAGISASGID
jgi:hypothetical protein